MDKIDWSKAPEGYDYWIVDHEGDINPGFHKLVDDRYYAEDGTFWMVDSFWFKDGVASVYPRPQPDNKEGEGVEWEPGVDLPPEGTECLVTPAGHYIGEWYLCKVIAHYEGEAIFKPGGNFPLGPHPFMAYPPAHFKPTQPHRDKVIEAAMKVKILNERVGYTLSRAAADALYEAGSLKLPGDEQ